MKNYGNLELEKQKKRKELHDLQRLGKEKLDNQCDRAIAENERQQSVNKKK